MKGAIVYNGFWNREGPSDPVQRLQKAAAERGIPLAAFPNTALTAMFGPDGPAVLGLPEADFVLFWDKDVRLARTMEACGVRVYNAAEAVAVCDDKAATHLALAGGGIPMPRTLVAPMTYLQMDQPGEGFLALAEERLGFPMVVKECYGSLGGQVYLARNGTELRGLAERMAARPFIAQEFVASSAGRDIRLYMAGGRLIAAMRRYSDTDFRANIGGGGRAEAYTPTAEEIHLAARCCSLLKLDFGGVDLLPGEDGRPLVCEVNSNAHMAALTACSGVDVAGAILEHVLGREAERG